MRRRNLFDPIPAYLSSSGQQGVLTTISTFGKEDLDPKCLGLYNWRQRCAWAVMVASYRESRRDGVPPAPRAGQQEFVGIYFRVVGSDRLLSYDMDQR